MSDATAYDLKSTQGDWTIIQNLRTEEEEILPKIEAEITTTKDACQV